MKPGGRSLKLEDIKELQALVAEQLDAVEQGLRLLDTGVSLGSATIDLLGQDANGCLTLIAIGFDANDEMVMRALEAYSWCVEDFSGVRRLYPSAGLSAAEPPRVMFVAETVPDAFRRKIKHLRFDRVDCFEFHFGLRFNLVEEVRGTHAPPAPPAPAVGRAERAEGTARASAPSKPRAEARRREEPAPPPRPIPPGSARAMGDRWGGGKPAREVADVKVRVVREYLQREFPTAVIYDFFSHDLAVQMFHLQDSHGAVIHSAAVAEDLLGESSEARIAALLDEHKLARALRDAGTAIVSVGKAGAKIEKR